MSTPEETRKTDAQLRRTLILIALGAAALALEWHYAHVRTQQRDSTPKPSHRAQHFSTAATPPPDLMAP
jgi:hypothetical protein